MLYVIFWAGTIFMFIGLFNFLLYNALIFWDVYQQRKQQREAYHERK